MDPQDLLYTNIFENTSVITDKQLDESRKNYSRFREYIGDREIDTNEYIDNDGKESNPFNINKTLQEPYPTNLKKNHYPLFDKYTQDIVKSTYQKEKVTKVSINSKDRNHTNYLYPNNFSIPFNKTFTNINKIKIDDICMPNMIPPVTNYNNCLAWQYASKDLLDSYLINDNIIPVPNNLNIILYSSLPNSLADIPYQESNYLVYQSFIPEGYYNTIELEKSIRTSSAQIVHGCSYMNFFELQNHRNSTLNNEKYPWKNPYEEPYYSDDNLKSTPTLFKFTIDPIKNTVFAVNRMEELDILAIQTFEQGTSTTDLSEFDVFNAYSSNQQFTFNPEYIYVTVKNYPNTSGKYASSSSSPNPFPLVLTDLMGEVGGIPTYYINYTEFFDLNIYTGKYIPPYTQSKYTESELNSISTYKLYDDITFTDKFGVQHKYLRFALKLSAGTNNGRRDTPNGGWVIYPSSNSTILYNIQLATALLSGQTDGGYYGENIEINSSLKPYIGRALLFRFIFDYVNGQYVDYEVDTANIKKKSIMNILAWPIPNNSEQTVVISSKPTFAFIHSNITGLAVQQNVQNVKNAALPLYYRSPVNKLNLQLCNGHYYFMANNYYYLKITPTGIPIVNTNMDVAVENANYQINQNYVIETYFNTGIGGDYLCLPSSKLRIPNTISKNYQGVFGKFILSSQPNNIETKITQNTNFVVMYDQPIDQLNSVTIQILDENMVIYPLGRDFSFTLEITEVMDILKETLIDTKRDTVVTTGYKNY